MYILVVDDEQLALDGLEREVKKVFPTEEIHKERKPKEAIAWASQMKEDGESLSYAFLDVQMAGMSGIELALKLKTLFPNVKIIFCTAYTQYAYDAFGVYAIGYLLKPIVSKDIERVLENMVSNWKEEAIKQKKKILVQTFGNFEVFVDGKPIVFEREKAKELMAYLVDRHGSAVTTKEIASILWESGKYDTVVKNKTTTIVSLLRNSLRKAGIEDILIKSWNQLSIDTGKIKCDAYDYEKGDALAVNSFRGEYMTNYSWAEYTTGIYEAMKREKIY